MISREPSSARFYGESWQRCMVKGSGMAAISGSSHKAKGLPVVLIHGLGSSKKDWDGLVPALKAEGFYPLTLDLLGHGESAKPDDPSQYHVETVYSEFCKWVDRQGVGQPLSLVGHSLGGYMALKYALEQPERVRALVLVDPFYKLSQLSAVMRGVHRRPELSSMVLQRAPRWLVRMVLTQMPRGAAQFSWELSDRIADDLKQASPHILHVSATLPDLDADLPNLSVPALVVWGEGDLTLRPSSFDTLVELLPNAVARPFDGCGHQPHLARPDVFNRLVAGFLVSPSEN
jgi:pimeloyl-ACP methyl ester carboxylesterase